MIGGYIDRQICRVGEWKRLRERKKGREKLAKREREGGKSQSDRKRMRERE